MSTSGDYKRALDKARLSRDWSAAAGQLIRDADALEQARITMIRMGTGNYSCLQAALVQVSAIRTSAVLLSRLADAQAYRDAEQVSSMAVPVSDALREANESRLRDALRLARELTEPGEPNREYIRGQVNLISDLFGFPSDGATYDLLTSAISHEITVDQAIAAIRELSA